MSDASAGDDGPVASRRDETWAFITLAVLLFPFLSVIVVGGFGFIVWMQQLLFGPPAG